MLKELLETPGSNGSVANGCHWLAKTAVTNEGINARTPPCGESGDCNYNKKPIVPIEASLIITLCYISSLQMYELPLLLF